MVNEEGMADKFEQADSFKERIYASTIDIERCCSREGPPSGGSVPGTAHAVPSSITKWTTFWDSFELAADSSPGLYETDKFNYLRSLLEKSAAEALTLTADSYNEAITTIKRRFGNKQQIIAKHMDALLNLDTVSSQHNLKGL